VDDNAHAIFKFTNDGKKLVQTIGTPKVSGNDDKHFNRPTFMTWLPDGTFFVSDGYANTRIVKFDKDGKYLMTWGMPGESGKETQPGYMNNVHGIAVDPQTRRVFVNDRNNGRVQVFDENGKYLDEWSYGGPLSNIHLFLIPSDRNLWAADRNTERILKYDLNGNFLYQFGTAGNFPGGFWGVHGMATDQEGNFYVAEVYSGRAQKFHPRKDANPTFLLGKLVAGVWK
jgi:peptidylamidoglycolate lyase